MHHHMIKVDDGEEYMVDNYEGGPVIWLLPTDGLSLLPLHTSLLPARLTTLLS